MMPGTQKSSGILHAIKNGKKVTVLFTFSRLDVTYIFGLDVDTLDYEQDHLKKKKLFHKTRN